MITKHTTFKKRLQIVNSLKSELRHIFADAKRNNQTQKYILDQITDRVYNNKYSNIQYLTGGERFLIQGYTDCLFDDMWNYLEWVHWYNSVFVGTNLPYGDKFDNLLVQSAFVYKGTQNKY